MRLFEHTCPTPSEDVAYDEALLDLAEAGDEPFEALRLWESAAPAVVVGRSSSLAAELREAACLARGVPILRRSSGGTAVVIGPGCLMYSVVLCYDVRPHLRSIDETHRFVLSTVLEGVRTWMPDARREGTSDLVVGDRKFSGNSLRCRRRHLLYHGTLLYGFDLGAVTELLGTSPPRQPEYRAGRPHRDFLANLDVRPELLRLGLRRAFDAQSATFDVTGTEAFAAALRRTCDPQWTRRVP